MNSLEYWRQREDEARQKNKKTEEQLKKETGERIEYMLNQMNKEIARFYSKYANDEDISISEAKKRVTQLDIDEYARKAKKYVKEKDFSDEANAEMKLYNLTMKINRLELLKANLGLETVDCFNDLQKYYEDALTEESLKEFQRMSGILGKTVLNNGQQARELANTSFQNATFSQRIWGHSAIFRDEVSKLLTQGLTAGINSMELARRLRKTVDSTKHQAETLMVTEMSRVRSGAQLISIEENGYDSYVFVSDPIEGAGHACHVCKSLDGKIFKVKDGRAGENMPPMHPWCRCSIAAHFGVAMDAEIDEALYELWLDTYKNHGENYNEWYENHKNDDANLSSLPIEIPERAKNIKNITEEDIKEINESLNKLIDEYNVHIDDVAVRMIIDKETKKINKSTPFAADPKATKSGIRFDLVINKYMNYNMVRRMINSGTYAGRSVSDFVTHEVGHMLTYQNCKNSLEFLALKKIYDKKYFVEGVSGYSDKKRIGTETIAECFVKYKNGEEIPQNIMELIKIIESRWKK